jgi:hypothetical protein
MRYQRNLSSCCPFLACRPSRLNTKVNGLAKSPQIVTPAEAGVQKTLERLDSRLRGNDRKKHLSTFFDLVEVPIFYTENNP